MTQEQISVLTKELRDTAADMQSFAVEPEFNQGCLMDAAADIIDELEAEKAGLRAERDAAEKKAREYKRWYEAALEEAVTQNEDLW